MIDAPHFGFIVAAYAIAALVIVGDDCRDRSPIIARRTAALRRLEAGAARNEPRRERRGRGAAPAPRPADLGAAR